MASATGSPTTAGVDRRVEALARVPIRLRLTLVFAAAMAVVLAAIGLFLYVRLGAALDATVDRGLRSRVGDVAALARTGASVNAGDAERLAGSGDSISQVLTSDGAVVDGTPGPGRRALLRDDELTRAARGPITVEHRMPGSDDSVRLLATPVEARGGRRIAVAGASLEPRGEALESLLTQLLIGGPIALVLASLAGYALAAAALRPVETMRREADQVSATQPGRRLALPPARDEVRRLAETLNAMLARLEDALDRERRFVSDASHELRTPLAALRAELELALRRPRTAVELEDSVRSAADETERLSRLAEDMLVLARSDAGKLPVRRERVPATTLLASVRERYEERARAADRELAIDADSSLEVSADRLRAEQALGNLVENALRHGSGPVLLQARGRDGRVELHVVDRGEGFAPEFLEQAFERFSRADPARTGGGAGLGLAIVDVIAQAHGGTAHLANANGGADAWLELPDRSPSER